MRGPIQASRLRYWAARSRNSSQAFQVFELGRISSSSTCIFPSAICAITEHIGFTLKSKLLLHLAWYPLINDLVRLLLRLLGFDLLEVVLAQGVECVHPVLHPRVLRLHPEAG